MLTRACVVDGEPRTVILTCPHVHLVPYLARENDKTEFEVSTTCEWRFHEALQFLSCIASARVGVQIMLGEGEDVVPGRAGGQVL